MNANCMLSAEEPVLVILSHQGGSFIEKIKGACDGIGVKCCVLSSNAPKARRDQLRVTFEVAEFREAEALNQDDVKDFIGEVSKDRKVLGVISVWEGYRDLMSFGNALVGGHDISIDSSRFLRDKKLIRDRLRSNGLSDIASEVACAQSFEKRGKKGTRSFIKPRFGVGSVGAKEFSGMSDLGYISDLKEDVANDALLREVLGTMEFVIEDYIDGQEYSAEIVVANGAVFTLAFHHKLLVHHGVYTTTEPFSVSPPVELVGCDRIQIWMQDVFKALDVSTGCYHAEFKMCAAGKLELIELNPRVGGALIIESTNYITDDNILGLWIKTIVDRDFQPKLKNPLVAEAGAVIRCSAFRVYFSETTGIVDQISYKNISKLPTICNTLVSIGDRLSRDKSEQYLAQALWVGEAANSAKAAEFHNHIMSISENYLTVDIKTSADATPVFVVLDYNLSRKKDVIKIAEKVYEFCGTKVLLASALGKGINHPNIENFESVCTRSTEFVTGCIEFIKAHNYDPIGGVVFSDDAIVTGSRVLEYYNLKVDSHEGALRSYDKLQYRRAESAAPCPEGVNRPRFKDLSIPADYRALVADISAGWVVKPRCEGNNRGVVVVKSALDLNEAMSLNQNYAGDGLLAEELIKIGSEYSVDGVGSLNFITKKISVRGKFPLEVGQVMPAGVDPDLTAKLLCSSAFANALTGQKRGAFHNEIMLCENSNEAYVVEPNRRPGGMQIWDMILDCYGVDLYSRWVRSALDGAIHNPENIAPKMSCGFLMLHGPVGTAVNQMALLRDLDTIVDKIWDRTGVPLEKRPQHLSPSFISTEDYVFESQAVDGHGFLMSIRFNGEFNPHFEELLVQFHLNWQHHIFDALHPKETSSNPREIQYVN